MRPISSVVYGLVLGALAAGAAAQEFRQINRIPTLRASALPDGARAVTRVEPVPAAVVEAAVRDIAAAWNTPALDSRLADNFYDKSRLLGTLAADVPRDAALRVVAIQGSQTVAQYIMAGPDGQPTRYSRVSVTVRTQVEYNDPQKGLQRLDGTNDLILRIEEPAP